VNAEVRELPLFPLNTVLFPGGPLPLRIFEPRYLDMVSRCMREQSGFAVVLLGEGEEVSSATSFAATGTEARIVDFDRLEGGLLGISCLGRERVRVVEAWREADGLNRGRVLDIAADPVVPVPIDLDWLKDVVARVLPEAGDAYKHVEMRDDIICTSALLDDPARRFFHLLFRRHRLLLECRSSTARHPPPGRTPAPPEAPW